MLFKMKRKLFIHIGTGKTGTTALQMFLCQNKNQLLKHGYKYADSYLENFNHHGLCVNACQLNEDEIKHRLDTLANEIINLDKNMIISSEYFPGLSTDDIKLYCDILSVKCDVHVVVYFRRQDEFLEAWFNQVVKSGELKREIKQLKQEIEDIGAFDYYQLANKWAEFVGVNNVHVRPYEKQQWFNGKIESDFLYTIGIHSVNDFAISDAPVNVSWSRDQILLMQFFDRMGKNELLQKFLEKPPKWFFSSKNKYMLSPAERVAIIESFQSSNEKVAKVFLNRPDGILFYNPLPNKTSENWYKMSTMSIAFKYIKAKIHIF